MEQGIKIMFKIVASFTRPNTDHAFFNDLYMKNDIIHQIHKNADLIPGYLGIDEDIYRDEFRCDKAMCFENEHAFLKFTKQNQNLLDQRLTMIEEYCRETGHEYKYYMLID